MGLPIARGSVPNRLRTAAMTSAIGVLVAAILLTTPVAAQEFSGGTEIESFLQSFLPWALRWMLVIGTIIGVFAHIFAGWTSDPDKAFRRKEWRNRALGGVALAIPALIVMNSIITTFGGEPIDFLPFI